MIVFSSCGKINGKSVNHPVCCRSCSQSHYISAYYCFSFLKNKPADRTDARAWQLGRCAGSLAGERSNKIFRISFFDIFFIFLPWNVFYDEVWRMAETSSTSLFSRERQHKLLFYLVPGIRANKYFKVNIYLCWTGKHAIIYQ